MNPMPRVPESTKTSLRQRLNTHARALDFVTLEQLQSVALPTA